MWNPSYAFLDPPHHPIKNSAEIGNLILRCTSLAGAELYGPWGPFQFYDDEMQKQ